MVIQRRCKSVKFVGMSPGEPENVVKISAAEPQGHLHQLRTLNLECCVELRALPKAMEGSDVPV